MPDLKMPQLNMLTLAGRLARDPELKYTSAGTATVKTSMAVDNGYGDKKSTVWVTLQIWGKYAESVYPSLHKGTPLIATGRLDVYEWETKDGEKRKDVVIVADRVQTLVWDKGDADTPRSASAPSGATQAASPQDSGLIPPDDDIPF